MSKHCDLASFRAASHPILILSRQIQSLEGFWLRDSGWREGKTERRAITCSFKEQMESFCASFPPFPLPSAYLNDTCSPNIQLLSWEFPLWSPLNSQLWACVCVCVLFYYKAYQSSVCVCACVCRCLCGCVREHQEHPPSLSDHLPFWPPRIRTRAGRREEGMKGRDGKKPGVGVGVGVAGADGKW